MTSHTRDSSHPPTQSHSSLSPLAGAAIGAAGFCLGMVISAQGLATAATIALTSGGAAAAATFVRCDHVAMNRRDRLQQQIDTLLEEKQQQKRELLKQQNKISQLTQALHHGQSQFAALQRHAKEQEILLQQQLNEALSAYQTTSRGQSQARDHAASLEVDVRQLQSQVDEAVRDRDEVLLRLQDLMDSLQDEIEQQTAVRLGTLRQQEIKQVATEYNAIASQLFTLFDELVNWATNIKESHDTKSNLLRGLAQQYNEAIDKLQSSVREQIDAYLNQIEILNVKLARTQALSRGEILEVEKGEFGYSPEGRIANSIAVWIADNLQIPLKVEQFHARESGIVEAGYSYSRSANPAAIAEAILGVREQCARNLGIFKIESVKKLEVTDCLTISFRQTRPASKLEKSALYRSKEDFIKFMLSSRLFFRFVGSPGSGKTPSVMVVLAHLLQRGFLAGNVPEGKKLDYTLVELCNSLEGISVKNGDETEIFTRWQDVSEAMKSLQIEYSFRKDPANKSYKDSVGYIWACDEFDNAIATTPRDEFKIFMQTLRDGGHVNMGAIIMGQNVMVSNSNFKIEDQKFFTNVLLDPVAIRTFLEEYGKKFYSDRAVKAALATLEQIEAEMEETNEYICDTARQLRVAMVVAERSPVFYQLPYFDSTEIDKTAYEDTRKKIRDIRARRPISAPSASVQAIAETNEIAIILGETDATFALVHCCDG